MKTITQKEAKRLIGHILDNHEKFKGAYFFRSPGNASSRRSYEKRNFCAYAFSFEKKGEEHTLELTSSVTCSCKNIYYTGIFIIDGKKVDIRGVKKINKLLSGEK